MSKVHKSMNNHSSGGHSNGSMPKVVGPNVMGNREEYQLVRRLQSALFGGVYEAKGLTSNRDFAIKVLHKSELTKAQESSSIEFCEVPLSEVRFAELMRGNQHVMEPQEHFEDAYCFYVVFQLCRGGDLLEALKQKPHGFDEAHAQFLIKQAAIGLAFLHERKVAMQDVSLENMLLHVDEKTGNYEVKICDPGQAVIFETDETGEESHVGFRGLVGKSFRPPELHDQQPYAATKVDSWCLGWSTFYLLTAQPLFMSADPAQQDSDWLLFQNGDFAALFQQKCNLCSPTALDFIFRLLQIKPRNRMSIADALNHSWLADPLIEPVRAPKEVIDEMLGVLNSRAEADGYDNNMIGTSASVADGSSMQQSYNPPATMGFGTSELPTWKGANPNSSVYSSGGAIFGGVPYGTGSSAVPYGGQLSDVPGLRVPMQRPRSDVRSPPRSPRSPRTSGPQQSSSGPRLLFDRMPFDRFGDPRARYPNPARMAHVIATAHSPVAATSLNRGGSPPPRATSPLQRLSSPGTQKEYDGSYSNSALPSAVPAPAHILTPRSGSGRHSPGPAQPSRSNTNVTAANSNDGEDRGRGRAWAFRSESPSGGVQDSNGRARATSPFGSTNPSARPAYPYASGRQGRTLQSPGRSSGAGITFSPRSMSPEGHQAQPSQNGQPVRALSPGANVRALSPNGTLAGSTRLGDASGGFNWGAAAPPLSPRGLGGNSVARIASPGGQMGVTRIASPTGGIKTSGPIMQGFAWSPDPPSPRTSPRSYSPAPGGYGQTVKSTLPRWPM